MWIQIDEMDNIDKKVKSKIPKADSSTRAAKFFNAETQSHAIFALDWNVDANSAIACRETDYEVFGKINQKIVLPFVWLSIVQPTWNMFTLHHKDAVSVKIIWASMGQEKDIKATTKWSSELSKPFSNRWSELRQMKPMSQKIDFTDVPTGGFTFSQTRQ